MENDRLLSMMMSKSKSQLIFWLVGQNYAEKMMNNCGILKKKKNVITKNDSIKSNYQSNDQFQFLVVTSTKSSSSSLMS